MATKNPEKNPSLTEEPGAGVQSQAQSTSAEAEHKAENDPNANQNKDEIRYFDTTIAKIKKIKDEVTGKVEEVTVMSDHLMPGEELKTARDERRAAEKAKKAEEKRAADAKK